MAEISERIGEILDECKGQIMATILDDATNGANDYAWVRVYPDGSVTSGREVSECCGEAEYYGRVPHPLTIWSKSGMREKADPSTGMFAWKPAPDGRFIGEDRTANYKVADDIDDDEMARLVEAGWYRFDLDFENLVEPIEIHDDETKEMWSRLESWAQENLQP